MHFKNWFVVNEQLTVTRYKARQGSEGIYYGLKVGRTRVGHVGGIEYETSERNADGELVDVHYFSVMNVSLDEDQRGQGLFQPALQQIADMFPDGVRSAKVQTSKVFESAMRKMPTYKDGGRWHIVLPSRYITA